MQSAPRRVCSVRTLYRVSKPRVQDPLKPRISYPINPELCIPPQGLQMSEAPRRKEELLSQNTRQRKGLYLHIHTHTHTHTHKPKSHGGWERTVQWCDVVVSRVCQALRESGGEKAFDPTRSMGVTMEKCRQPQIKQILLSRCRGQFQVLLIRLPSPLGRDHSWWKTSVVGQRRDFCKRQLVGPDVVHQEPSCSTGF